MNNKALYDYLRSLNLLDNGTDEEIAKATIQFRREQNRARIQRFRNKHFRCEVFMTKDEHSLLYDESKKHGLKLGRFIKLSAISYVQKEYIVPDTNRLNNLELGIRKIGNNVNQLVRFTHAKGLSESTLSQIQKHLNELEDRISTALQQPLNLNDFLRKLLKENPEYATTLQSIINECRI